LCSSLGTKTIQSLPTGHTVQHPGPQPSAVSAIRGLGFAMLVGHRSPASSQLKSQHVPHKEKACVCDDWVRGRGSSVRSSASPYYSRQASRCGECGAQTRVSELAQKPRGLLDASADQCGTYRHEARSSFRVRIQNRRHARGTAARTDCQGKVLGRAAARLPLSSVPREAFGFAKFMEEYCAFCCRLKVLERRLETRAGD